MNPRIPIFILVAIVLVEVVFLFYNQKRKPQRDPSQQTHRLGEPLPKWEAAAAAAAAKKRKPSNPSQSGSAEDEPTGSPSHAAAPIRTAQQAFKSAGSRQDILNGLEKRLLALPPETAIRQILAFLNSGEDAPTGTRLIPGDGRLASASSLRVALLDLLGRICRKTETREAADVARGLLKSLDSADEFAVCLRNVAWAEPDSTGYLSERLDSMLVHEPWRQNPSGGYEAALDIAAFLGEPQRLGILEECMKSDHAGLQLSVDAASERLCERSPLETLRLLNRKAQLLSGRPRLRALLFSKADLSHPGQREAAENYLGRPDVGMGEKVTFLEELWREPSEPVPALLTPPPERPGADIRSLRALEALNQWLAEGRFAPLKLNMEAVQRRLKTASGAAGQK